MRQLALVFASLVLSSVAATADTLVTSSVIGPTDSVNWAQLGPEFSSIPNPFNFTTTGGVTGFGSYFNNAGAANAGQVLVQGSSWLGNFAPGEYVNWTQGNGPITLTFNQGFKQIGAHIQEAFYGAFVAQICDINGCFTENGNSTGAGDGSAIYLGIYSGTPINSVTFSILSAAGDPNDFAIDQMTLGGSPTPEPSTLLMLGSGLVGLAGFVRRKFTSSSSRA